MAKFLRKPWLYSRSKTKAFALGAFSIDHLVEMAQGVNDKLHLYQEVSRQMQAMSKHWVVKAAKIDEAWGGLSDAASAGMSDVMRAATRARFDPTAGATANNPDETSVQTAYDALIKAHPDVAKVFTSARDHYADIRNERKSIALSILKAANAERIAKAVASGDTAKIQEARAKLNDQIKEFEDKFNEVKGPYFPLLRVGEWYTVAKSATLLEMEAKPNKTKADNDRIKQLRKDENHYTTSAYSSEGKAVEAMEELRRKFGADNVTYNKQEEKNVASSTMSQAGLSQVEEYIANAFPEEVAVGIRSMMADLYYDSLPEHHALKREMHREGIHGEEKDMRRVFAITAIKGAHYLSRLKHADGLKSSLLEIRKEAKSKGVKSTEYANEISKRMEIAMDSTRTPIADIINNVSYFAHLGLNPAFILTNATQVAMITAPWLAARTSTVEAAAALGSAYVVAGKIVATSLKGDRWGASLDWTGKVSAGVSNMLETQLNRNLLDITIEHDLGATANESNHKLGRAAQIANLPVHVTELTNRLVTAIAAYKLAVNSRNMSHADAVEFASKAVSQTQLDYSALNSPRYAQSIGGNKSIAKLSMQFRKYQQGMLWLVGRSLYQTAAAGTMAEKKEAFKTFLGLSATTAAMTGTTGLPLMTTFFTAANMAVALSAMIFGGAGGKDDPWDAKQELAIWAIEAFGEKLGTAFLKGLPAAFGLDVSKRIGLADIANPMSFAREGKDIRSTVGNYATAAAGAGVGTMIDIAEGIALMAKGDTAKGLEKAVPVKGVQNLIRANRFANEGMTTYSGSTILGADEFNAGHITAKALGFSTTKESTYYDDNQAVEGAKKAAMDVRSSLLSDYVNAKIAGDNDAMGATQDKIDDFNDRHPEKGVKIDYSTKTKSWENRKRTDQERNESGVIESKANKPFLNKQAYRQ